MCAKTYIEPQTAIPVYDECDILVVGGGSAGHSAAIAAARAGNKNIILMERYGYCGGDVTGGYVLLIPSLSFHEKTYVRGLQEEWYTRLQRVPGGVMGAPAEFAGSHDRLLIRAWEPYGGATRVAPGRVEHGFMLEPNLLKIELDVMLREHADAIRVLYHTLGVKPIMEGNVCKGVFFESKEGRRAILAKQVIDATGDADLCRLSGAPTSSAIDDECRCGSTALVYRIGGVDYRRFRQWRENNPEDYGALVTGAAKIHGFRSGMFPTPQHDVLWVNNWQPKRDCSKIADQTATEMGTRVNLLAVLDYYRAACPEVFRNAYLYDIAPQLGARGSHRIVGEHVIGANDWAFPKEHDDCIAWHCTVDTLNDNAPIEIPYRAILPQKVDNLLAPGRHISADAVAIDNVNLIPQCVGTGQAAGVAAAVAVAEGSSAHSVSIRKVQDILAGEQDVPLPRNEHTDPSYTECLVEHEYGLYTDAAKRARESKDAAGTYRHWSLTKGAGDANNAHEG